MSALWHPIKHIIFENIGPCIDQIGKNLFWFWLLKESIDFLMFINPYNTKPSWIFNFPEGQRTNPSILSVQFKHRLNLKRGNNIPVKASKGTAHHIAAISECATSPKGFVFWDNSNIEINVF